MNVVTAQGLTRRLGATSLILAAEQGHLENVKYLVTGFIPPKWPTSKEAKVLRKDTGKATVPLEFPVGGTFNATAARKVPRKLL